MFAIHGRFDGKVFVPDEPVDLPQNQRVILHVEMATENRVDAPSGNLWDVLRQHAGSIEAPTDWSAEHDHYLYGIPKRQEGK